MQSFIGISHLFLLQLQLVPAQWHSGQVIVNYCHCTASSLSIEGVLKLFNKPTVTITPTTNEPGPRVVTFLELWSKSTCQPMEQLVDVEQQFPGETNYAYVPSCVPLHRCSGCCMDESMECHPTLERNVTIELIRISPLQFSNNVMLNFVEHQACECRRQQQLPKQKGSESIKTKGQKKTKKTANSCRQCQFP